MARKTRKKKNDPRVVYKLVVSEDDGYLELDVVLWAASVWDFLSVGPLVAACFMIVAMAGGAKYAYQ